MPPTQSGRGICDRSRARSAWYAGSAPPLETRRLLPVLDAIRVVPVLDGVELGLRLSRHAEGGGGGAPRKAGEAFATFVPRAAGLAVCWTGANWTAAATPFGVIVGYSCDTWRLIVARPPIVGRAV